MNVCLGKHTYVETDGYVCMSGETYIPRKLEVCRYVKGMYVWGNIQTWKMIGMYVCLGKHTYLENYRYVCMSGCVSGDTYIYVCMSGETYIHT